MEIIDKAEFIMRTWASGWPPRMNTTIYDGKPYECACGSTHLFEHENAIRELPKMHLVMQCPDGEGVVCVKIKGIFSTTLVSEYGAREEDSGHMDDEE